MLARIIIFVFGTTNFIFASVDSTQIQILSSSQILNPSNNPEESSAIPLEIISAKNLETQTHSLSDILAHQAGLQNSAFTGDGFSQELSIRGIPGNRVDIYLDGLLLNRGSGNILDISSLPISEIESIEIYRSTVPVKLGSNSLGGAIQIRSKSPQKKSSGFLKLKVGSLFSNELSLLMNHKISSNTKFLSSFTLQGSQNKFSYLEDPTPLVPGDEFLSTRSNAKHFHLSALFHLSSTSKHHKNHTIFKTLSEKSGIPGTATHRTQYAHQTQQRNSFSYQHEYFKNQFSWNTILFVENSKQGLFWNWEKDHLYFPSNQNEQIENSVFTLQAKTTGNWVLSPQWTISSGTQLSRDHLTPIAFEQLQNPISFSWEVNRLQSSNYGNLKWSPNNSLQLSAGGEFSATQNQSKGGVSLISVYKSVQPSKIWQWEPSWNSALIWKKHTWSISLSGGENYRIPTLSELFGSPSGVLPEPDLKTERIKKIDFSVRSHFKSLQSRISFFYNQSKNLVSYLNSGGLLRASNLDASKSKGLELSLQSNFIPTLQNDIQWTYQQAVSLCNCSSYNGDPLPGEAPYTLFIKNSWTPISYISTSWSIDYKSHRYAAPGKSQPLHSHILHDFELSLQTNQFLRFTFSLLNITDRKEQTLYLNSPQPGRRFFLQLQQRF